MATNYHCYCGGKNLLGGEALVSMSRTPEIIADAAYYILSKPSDKCTGNTFIDEEVLQKKGSQIWINIQLFPVQNYTEIFLYNILC